MKCVRHKFNENKLNKKCLFFWNIFIKAGMCIGRKMSITLNLYNSAVEDILSCVKSSMEIVFFFCVILSKRLLY